MSDENEIAASPVEEATKTIEAAKPGDPRWMPDSASSKCLICMQEFGWFSKKHHCRMCGFITCEKCSSYKKEIGDKKERVCKPCFEGKKEQDRQEYEVTLVFNGMTSKKGKVFWIAYDYRAADNFPPKDDIGTDVGHGEISLEEAKEVKDKSGKVTYTVTANAKFPQTVVAVTGFHSELGLNTIRAGTFGIPKDGIFVSRDGFNSFGAPKFKDCCKLVDQKSTWDMSIKYYLSGGDEEMTTIDVTIPHTEGAKMDIKYEPMGGGKGLTVKGIKSGGVLEAWNKGNADKAIKDGDFLLAINKESAQDQPTEQVWEQLSKLLKEEAELTLQFGRVTSLKK